MNTKKAVLVYAWWQSPHALRVHSIHGGDEEWMIIQQHVPDSEPGWCDEDWPGVQVAEHLDRCDSLDDDYPKIVDHDGSKIAIWITSH